MIHAVVLMLLFMAAYFTHLAGFLLAVAGALAAVILTPPRRVLPPFIVLAAALPAGCLAMNYFEETGFFRAPAAMRVIHEPLHRLSGDLREADLEKDLTALDDELFAYQAGKNVPLGAVLGLYLVALTGVTVIDTAGRPRPADDPGRIFPAVFAGLLLATYLLVPDHLGGNHDGLPNGGFLKARLAPLPPLVWLACLREAEFRPLRLALRAVTALLLGVNLWLVTATVRDGNHALADYTAGIDAVGRRNPAERYERLFIIQSNNWRSPLANPLLHAGDYYCLGTGAINLDNYEAMMPHFPVKYRPGIQPARGSWGGYASKDDVDVVLCWHADGAGPPGWNEVFHQGRLRIYRRPGPVARNP
ncbi:MAG TPA: hypothetical protein VH120_07895 [Gemmataceae bacterium]|nr:hypothetical protein [Gemmataceae bacterium]